MLKLQEIDSLDEKIIGELKRDARVKVSDMAHKLRVPQATIRLRMAKLENRKVIRGYAPILDFKKLGKPLTVTINFKVAGSFSQEELTVRILKKVPDVIGLYALAGETDGLLILRGEDTDDVNKKILALHTIPEIVSSSTHFVLRAFIE